jgi:hypothetical protein
MSDNYDALYVQRGATEAFQIAADDARKLRIEIARLKKECEDCWQVAEVKADLMKSLSALRRIYLSVDGPTGRNGILTDVPAAMGRVREVLDDMLVKYPFPEKDPEAKA